MRVAYEDDILSSGKPLSHKMCGQRFRRSFCHNPVHAFDWQTDRRTDRNAFAIPCIRTVKSRA